MVGIIAIIGYMHFRTAKNSCNGGRSTAPKQKLKYWGQIALLTTLLFCLWYLIDQVSIDFYGVHVVRIIDSFLISLLIVSLYFERFYESETVSNVE